MRTLSLILLLDNKIIVYTSAELSRMLHVCMYTLHVCIYTLHVFVHCIPLLISCIIGSSTKLHVFHMETGFLQQDVT